MWQKAANCLLFEPLFWFDHAIWIWCQFHSCIVSTFQDYTNCESWLSVWKVLENVAKRINRTGLLTGMCFVVLWCNVYSLVLNARYAWFLTWLMVMIFLRSFWFLGLSFYSLSYSKLPLVYSQLSKRRIWLLFKTWEYYERSGVINPARICNIFGIKKRRAKERNYRRVRAWHEARASTFYFPFYTFLAFLHIFDTFLLTLCLRLFFPFTTI